MLSKALAFLPNIVAAAIIFFIGRIVATIVREVVVNFLAASGADAGAERMGFGKMLGAKKLSGVVGTIVYFFIIIPVIVSAVDSLQITAISDPVKGTLEQVLAAVPSVLVAAIIVAVGYAIAKIVKGLVVSFLSGVGFDLLPDKLGLKFLKPKEGGATLSGVAGTVVLVIILLLTAQQALASLGLVQLAQFCEWIVDYLPQLAMGLVILLAALSLGQFVGRLAGDAAKGSGHGQVIGQVAKYAVIVLGVGMALDQLGISEQIVTAAVSMVLGGSALALGLAFGLGGKDKAKEIIEGGKNRP
jgi:hypothetical protein